MSQSPQQQTGSKRYADSWRAINEMIRSDASWSGRERNVCYRNDGDGKFTDVAFVSGLDFPDDGRSFTAFDIDRDGDLDLILKSRTGPQIRVLRNDWGARRGSGRSIEIELRGVRSNSDAVGARATLVTNQRRLLRVVRAEYGYLAQPSRRLHFALGDGEVPRTLEIRWPGGGFQTIGKVPSGHAFRVSEGSRDWERLDPPKPPAIKPPPEAPLIHTPGTWLSEPLPAPLFELDTSDGRKFALAAQRGKKLLLNFWATWCPPCRKELAEFAQNSEKLNNAGIVLAAVSVDAIENREQVLKFAAAQGLSFPILFADDEIVATYTVLNRHLFDRRRDLAIPTSFLVDEHGDIIKAYRGETPVSAILADASSQTRPAIPFSGNWHAGAPQRDYVEMATAMVERGLMEPAESLFTAAEAAGWRGNQLYNNWAGLLVKREEFERAAELLRTILKSDPDQVEALVNLGSILLRQRRFGEAVEVLSRAAALQPDDAAAHGALGLAYFTTGNLPAAEDSYRRAVQFDAGNPRHRHNLGSVLAAAGRFPEARAELEQARELGEDSVQFRNDLGVVYMQTGETGRAHAEFQSAVGMAPDDYDTNLNLAQYFFTVGDEAAARVWVGKAKTIQPDAVSAHMIEAQFLASQQRFAEAREVIRRYLAEHPESVPAQQMLRDLP